MWQLGVAVLSTAFVVAFGMANSHHVQLAWVLGEPVEMRLIFLLSIAFGLGVLTVAFHRLATRAARAAQAARTARSKRPPARRRRRSRGQVPSRTRGPRLLEQDGRVTRRRLRRDV